MSAGTQRIDVLAVMDRQLEFTIASDYNGAMQDHRDLVAARAAVADLIAQRDELRDALDTVMRMDVRGHQLQDRLQFSDPGRAILHQATSALAHAAGNDRAALDRKATHHDAATTMLINGVRALLESASPNMTHRNAKEREAYKTIRAAMAAIGGAA